MLFPIEIFLVLHYQPRLPLSMGPIILLLGISFLAVTRITNKVGRSWQSRYYIFSAIARPVGIAIISWGWLEILAWDRNIIDFYGDWQLFFIFGSIVPIFIIGIWRPILVVAFMVFLISQSFGDVSFAVYALIFVLSFSFGVWSIFHLGIRQSLLYRKYEDPLVTDGPYSMLRHPQLFAALAMTYSGSWMRGSSWGMFNCVLFGFMLWTIIRIEEKDLAVSYGEEYGEYKKRVKSLIPTAGSFLQLLSENQPGRTVRREDSHSKDSSLLRFLIALAVIGLMAAIAIPNFLKFQAKARMNLAGIDLQQIYDFQKRYHDIFGTYYDGKKRILGLEPDRWENTRYSWFIGPGLYIPSVKNPVTYDDLVAALKGLNRMDLLPGGDRDSFLSMIAENYDEDDCIEIWYINEKKEIRNLLNDLDMPCNPYRVFDLYRMKLIDENEFFREKNKLIH